MLRILVIASTLPASDTDHIPAFVKDQVKAFKQLDDSTEFRILAPHDMRSHTKSYTKHEAYEECRFHYFWPFRYEKLAGKNGIMTTLRINVLYYLLIPFLFIGEFVATLRHTLQFKPDVIYAHWFTPQAVIACAVSVLTRVPFVFTTHASDVNVWLKIPLIGKPIVRWAVRRARAFTAVSTRSMQKVEAFFSISEWNQLKKRSQIVPMGVKLPKFGKKTLATPATVVFIGRLVEKKGVQYLLPAFKKVLHKYPETRLVIGGDGLMSDTLRTQAHELGIDASVEFIGYVIGKEKEELLSSASVYVVPSIVAMDGDVEGLPVSLLDGLAYQKICIATNESGADDILTDGKDGLLIPQKQTNAIAAALENALSMSMETRTAMQKSARRTAEQYAWPIVAKKHADFLFKEKPNA